MTVVEPITLKARHLASNANKLQKDIPEVITSGIASRKTKRLNIIADLNRVVLLAAISVCSIGCRLCGKNPDIALFSAVEKFISRFRAMEMQVKNAGKCVEDLTLSEMDVYWEAGKQNG